MFHKGWLVTVQGRVGSRVCWGGAVWWVNGMTVSAPANWGVLFADIRGLGVAKTGSFVVQTLCFASHCNATGMRGTAGFELRVFGTLTETLSLGMPTRPRSGCYQAQVSHRLCYTPDNNMFEICPSIQAHRTCEQSSRLLARLPVLAPFFIPRLTSTHASQPAARAGSHGTMCASTLIPTRGMMECA